MLNCVVCGGGSYRDRVVIWDALAEGWGISPEERRIVDRQQGTYCTGCGSNLRSIALAEAIVAACGWDGTLQDLVISPQAESLRLLEINEAGTLSPVLRRLPGYVFGAYPEVDMQAMPFGESRFDLVVHSDTLEHVPDPAQALRECARVLTPHGALCFTVPVVPGRMSVSRAGLAPLYHGDPEHPAEDFRVHTDYGADVWHQVHQAGFAGVTLMRFDDALAIIASRTTRRRPATQPVDPVASELAAVLGSTSWRITAPLRAAARTARRVLGLQ